MSDKRKAEELANKAIDKAAEGDNAKAKELAQKAKKADATTANAVADEAESNRAEAASYQKRQPSGE